MFINDEKLQALCNGSMAERYGEMCLERWGECPYTDEGMINIDSQDQIDGNSVEVKLDTIFQFNEAAGIGLTYNGQRCDSVSLNSGESIDLVEYIKGINLNKDNIAISVPPRSKFLCQSREVIQIPPDLIGFLYVRSSYARMGINHLTSQVLKPTFCGHITFEIQNLSAKYETIRLNDPVIQLLFAECEISKTPYFVQKNARYQYQKGQLGHLRHAEV